MLSRTRGKKLPPPIFIKQKQVYEGLAKMNIDKESVKPRKRTESYKAMLQVEISLVKKI